jgi:hypothetical protein
VRWKVTVPAGSSATTPSPRSHGCSFPQSAAPTIAPNQPLPLMAADRSMDRLTSLARTVAPVEKVIPGRSWNRYDRPSSDGFGISVARSSTSVVLSGPPTRW